MLVLAIECVEEDELTNISFYSRVCASSCVPVKLPRIENMTVYYGFPKIYAVQFQYSNNGLKIYIGKINYYMVSSGYPHVTSHVPQDLGKVKYKQRGR